MKKVDELIPLEESFRIVDKALAGVRLSGETLPVREAHGRVLLGDQVSCLDLPPFDKSAMDGYAVLAGDERDEYQLLETVAAGQVSTKPLVPGTAVKVMTGAPVPAGSGRVIVVEYTTEQEGVVKVHKHGGAANICKKAEDIRCGDKILSAGTTLGTLELANLIACGVTEVEVVRRLRVAVISTGDEIVDHPDKLRPGKIMNSNGPMLADLAGDYGLEVVSEEALPDEKEATVGGIRRAVERADIILLSGGVSVGEFDYVLAALSDAGLEVHFSRVAAKPGKPTVFASAGDKVVFALPGNPVSVYLMFHLFVLRATALMTGAPYMIREFKLCLGSDFKRRKKERTQYVPCRLSQTGCVEPVEFHGSAHLAAIIQADGFFVVPAGVSELNVGQEVSFISTGKCRLQ